MSLSHHGDDDSLRRRFIDQIQGRAERRWPDGRVGGEDDGQLAYAIAHDKRHGIIRIDFGKPVYWLGLRLEDAIALRDKLSEVILEMRGITA